jgi:hypothetical protein
MVAAGCATVGPVGSHRSRSAIDGVSLALTIPGSQHSRVTFEGVVFTLPTGWTLARPRCGWPANKTVVIDYQNGPVPFCPAMSRPARLPTAVTLTTVYGPQYADGWAGRRMTWHGQPAWLAVQTNQGATTVTLTLPWLNATVVAESPSREHAWAMLGHLAVHLVPGLAVPSHVSSIFIQSLAGRDGDGLMRNATITRSADVRQLLADLRSLPPAASAQAACDGSWWPGTALLTVHPRRGPARTYAAQFGSCSQVIAGTGTATEDTPQLLADVRRLVPNSGL